MARIKRSLNAKKKRRRTLKMAKGYFGARSRCYRKAKEQVRHSLMYQYRDRRTKKREIRKLWIASINAGCRINGNANIFSRLISGILHSLKDQFQNLPGILQIRCKTTLIADGGCKAFAL